MQQKKALEGFFLLNSNDKYNFTKDKCKGTLD